MDRGLISKARGFPLEKQRAFLEAAGVMVIYEDAADAVSSLRGSDRLVIAGPLHVLASSRDAIRAIVADVKASGCNVYDLLHDESTEGSALEMFARAVDATNPAHHFGNASEMGKKGANKRWGGHESTGKSWEEAKTIWFDLSIEKNAVALGRMGWSLPRANRAFGGSGRKPGPTAKD